jgi:hypothetical protein
LLDIRGPTVLLGDVVNIRSGDRDSNEAIEGGQYPFFTCGRKPLAIDRYDFDCEAILLAGNNASADFNVKHYAGKFCARQLLFTMAGIAVLLGFAAEWIMTGALHVRPLMLAGVASMLVGVQFVSIGLLGEMINQRFASAAPPPPVAATTPGAPEG